MTGHLTTSARLALGASARQLPGLRIRTPQSLLLLAFLVLTAPAGAAFWTATGLDLLDADTPPAIENVRIGHDGTLRLAAELRPLAEPDADAVWRVVAGPAGRWYAGTGPAGRIYSAGAVAAEIDEGEVLALVHDPRVGLVCGLTPGGTVHRLRPDGTSEILFASGEDYIFDLLAGPGGEIYVATGPAGRLYRLESGGGTTLLFTASQSHIASLAWLEPGRSLLAGTSPDGLIYRLDLGPAGPEISVLYDTPADEVRALAVTRGADGVRVHAAANPAGDDSSAPGSVLCVGENGALAWEWTAPAGAVYALLPQEDGVIVATGNEGVIYELDRLGRSGVYQRLPAGRVLSLAASPTGVLAGTSEPASVSLLAPGLAASGLAESPVHDCQGPATFGAITRRADVPSGATLRLETRTGNSAAPDSTWSAWQPADGTVRSRPARFIQWRARLGSGFPGRTPTLERVDLHYAIPNRPPTVASLTIEEPSPADAARGSSRPVRTLNWQDDDPDGDSLSFALGYRPEGHSDWLVIEPELQDAAYQLDTRRLPDGWYRFRVVATDAPSRPAGQTLRAEALSTPYLIDNTPPRITGLRLDGGNLRFTVADEHSVISAVRVAVNAGAWQPAAPLDGLFDSPSEAFSLDLPLAAGTNHIIVWAADGQGNTATASLTVRR